MSVLEAVARLRGMEINNEDLLQKEALAVALDFMEKCLMTYKPEGEKEALVYEIAVKATVTMPGLILSAQKETTDDRHR